MARREVEAGVRLCESCGQEVEATRRRCPACGHFQAVATRRGPREGAPTRPEPAAGTDTSRVVVVGLAVAVMAGAGFWMMAGPAGQTAGPPAAAGTSRPLIETQVSAPARPATRSSPADGADAYEAHNAERAAGVAYAGGDLMAALEAYDKALSLDPSDTTTRGNRAQVLVRLGRVDEAMPDLDRVVQEQPEAWASHFNRGRAYSLLKRWPEALADYRAAAAIFPDDYVTQYNLGLAHARTNDHGGAIAAFERAVALAPGEPSFLVSLGTEYMAAARTTDARRVFEQYLNEHPDAPEVANVRQLLATLAAQ